MKKIAPVVIPALSWHGVALSTVQTRAVVATIFAPFAGRTSWKRKIFSSSTGKFDLDTYSDFIYRWHFFRNYKFFENTFKIDIFSNILSKFDNIFEIFRKKCKFRKYFRKFCNFEKSVMVDEVNTSPSLQLQTYVNTKDIYVIYLQCQSKFLVIILKYNDLIASLKSICV